MLFLAFLKACLLLAAWYRDTSGLGVAGGLGGLPPLERLVQRVDVRGKASRVCLCVYACAYVCVYVCERVCVSVCKRTCALVYRTIFSSPFSFRFHCCSPSFTWPPADRERVTREFQVAAATMAASQAQAQRASFSTETTMPET